MPTSTEIEISLAPLALRQLSELKAIWHLLADRTRFELVQTCHSAAVVVSTGHPVTFKLPSDLSERESHELRELADQWQFVRVSTHAALLTTAKRSIGR